MLRLHSTYRHDLKIYASDEGRVQMTAAAFAKVWCFSFSLLYVPNKMFESLLECKERKERHLLNGSETVREEQVL